MSCSLRCLSRISLLLMSVGIIKMATHAQVTADGVLVGDVKYTAEQYRAVFGGVHTMKALFTGRWPNGQVPYEFSSAYTESERETILEAMGCWENDTCIDFVERASEKYYLYFIKDGVCWSNIGMIVNGQQEISFGHRSCFEKRIILHVLGHALGLITEHRRPDRDDYVTVVEDNVENMEPFRKYDESQVETYGIPYDYKSVMHFTQYAWSINGLVTLVTTDPDYQEVIGRATSLSGGDIDAVNMMYSCPDHWTQWGDWSVCSVTCGTGYTSRRRQCSSGCNGTNSDEMQCVKEDCLVTTTTTTIMETSTAVPTTSIPTTYVTSTALLTTTSSSSTATSVSTTTIPTTPSSNNGREWSFLRMSVDPVTVYPGCSPNMRLRCSVLSGRREGDNGKRREEREDERGEEVEGDNGDETKMKRRKEAGGRGREESKLNMEEEGDDNMETLAETRVDRSTEWTALLLMKGEQTVASVTYYDSTKQYRPTTLYGNHNPNVSVDGNLLFGAEHGFLEVTWTEPGLGQGGVYQCVGVTDEFTASGARVRHSTAPTAVNIAHLHDDLLISNLTEHLVYLKQQISERDTHIEVLNEELAACGAGDGEHTTQEPA